jgi:hypothetical protein
MNVKTLAIALLLTTSPFLQAGWLTTTIATILFGSGVYVTRGSSDTNATTRITRHYNLSPETGFKAITSENPTILTDDQIFLKTVHQEIQRTDYNRKVNYFNRTLTRAIKEDKEALNKKKAGYSAIRAVVAKYPDLCRDFGHPELHMVERNSSPTDEIVLAAEKLVKNSKAVA